MSNLKSRVGRKHRDSYESTTTHNLERNSSNETAFQAMDITPNFLWQATKKSSNKTIDELPKKSAKIQNWVDRTYTRVSKRKKSKS